MRQDAQRSLDIQQISPLCSDLAPHPYPKGVTSMLAALREWEKRQGLMTDMRSVVNGSYKRKRRRHVCDDFEE